MPEQHFPIDPSRLYEVGRDGIPRTDTGQAPEWLGPRHRRILAWTALGAVVSGGCAGLTLLCFLIGARLAAAWFALATLATAPLLLVGPAEDWWRHRRPHRRRHRNRPGRFPGG
jgi:hypothetical protein